MDALLFKNYPKLRYGLSEKSHGAMESSRAILKQGIDPKNRKAYFTGQTIDHKRVVGIDSPHGAETAHVSKKDADTIFKNTDGVVTAEGNLFLSLTVADCFPIYFYDPINHVVGLAHAGWRGIAGGIIPAMVEQLKSCGADKNEILAYIGPGIRECHFEVQDDVSRLFSTYEGAAIQRAGKTFVHLPGTISRRLQEAGVSPYNIEDSELCTHCSKNTYFSFRRDKPKHPELMIAYIGMS